MLSLLSAISPFAFEVLKEGEFLRVQRKPPKKNEYRQKIGPPNECFLVFKGATKIGMISRDFMEKNPQLQSTKRCRVININQSQSLICVDISEIDSH
jgi:hypothetical protein